MSLIRLSKEDARREANISYADIKVIILVVSTAFGAYFFLEGKIEAAEQKTVQSIERASDAIEATQIVFQLDALEDRKQKIKAKYKGARIEDVITPSDDSDLARIEARIVRLLARQIILDSK